MHSCVSRSQFLLSILRCLLWFLALKTGDLKQLWKILSLYLFVYLFDWLSSLFFLLSLKIPISFNFCYFPSVFPFCVLYSSNVSSLIQPNVSRFNHLFVPFVDCLISNTAFFISKIYLNSYTIYLIIKTLACFQFMSLSVLIVYIFYILYLIISLCEAFGILPTFVSADGHS